MKSFVQLLVVIIIKCFDVNVNIFLVEDEESFVHAYVQWCIKLKRKKRGSVLILSKFILRVEILAKKSADQ